MLVIRSNPLASHGSVAPLKHPGVQVRVIHKSRIGELLSAYSGCPPAQRVPLVHAECRVKLHPLPSFLFFHHDQGSTSTMLLDRRNWEGRDCTKTPTLRTTVTFVSWLKDKGIMV